MAKRFMWVKQSRSVCHFFFFCIYYQSNYYQFFQGCLIFSLYRISEQNYIFTIIETQDFPLWLIFFFYFFQVERSLLVTGFGYEHDDAWAANIELFKEFTDISRVFFIFDFLVNNFSSWQSSEELFSFRFCFWYLGREKTWCCCSRYVPRGFGYCRSILGVSSEAMGYGCRCFGTFYYFYYYTFFLSMKWISVFLSNFLVYDHRLLKKLVERLRGWMVESFVCLIDLFWFPMVSYTPRSVMLLLQTTLFREGKTNKKLAAFKA